MGFVSGVSGNVWSPERLWIIVVGLKFEIFETGMGSEQRIFSER